MSPIDFSPLYPDWVNVTLALIDVFGVWAGVMVCVAGVRAVLRALRGED